MTGLRVGKGMRRVQLGFSPRWDERDIKQLTWERPGCLVTIIVPPGTPVPFSAVEYLRQYGQHLGGVNVECDGPTTRDKWLHALEHGAAGWVEPQ